MAKWMDDYKIGDHVVFTRGYRAEYPMSFKLRNGATGEVVGRVEGQGSNQWLEVLLDDHVPELQAWDNVLHLVPVDMAPNPGAEDDGPDGLVAKRVNEEAMDKAGWYLNQTGGGFSAWERDLGNGEVVRVSFAPHADGGHANGDPDRKAWNVGRYDSSDGYVELMDCWTLAEAMEFADVIPSPGGMQVSAGSLEEILAEMKAAKPSSPSP